MMATSDPATRKGITGFAQKVKHKFDEEGHFPYSSNGLLIGMKKGRWGYEMPIHKVVEKDNRG